MADRYCRFCGLEFAGDGAACPRCAAPRDVEAEGLFNPATGVPLDTDRAPPLRCWHCGQPIGQQQLICSNCSVPLTQRSSGAIAYDVVPRSVAPPPTAAPRPAEAPRPAPLDTIRLEDISDVASVNVPSDEPAIALPTRRQGIVPDVVAAASCFHCGFQLSRVALVCPRCGTDLVQPSDLSQNFDPLTGEDLFPGALRPEVTRPGGNDTDSEISPQTTARRTARWNIIARHWHGELPLAVSFWVIVVLLDIGLAFFVPRIIDTLPLTTDPKLVFAWLVFAWTFIISLAAWEFVGLFRSARRRRRERWATGRGALWPIAAMVGVGITVVGMVYAIAIAGTVQFRIMTEIAFLGDPSVPDYTVTVGEDRTTLFVSGGVKFGIAGAIESALVETPTVDTIVLNSIGGRVGAAQNAFEVVRRYGLATHVDRLCASACTIIFAAGTERTIGTSARLGYHRSTIGYQDDAADAVFRDLMLDDGLDAAFVARVIAVPPWDIWYPTRSELYYGNIITELPR